MSDFAKWPQERFPLVFQRLLTELPTHEAPRRVAVEDLPWSASSSRLRFFSYAKRFGLPGLAWRVSIFNRADGGSDLLVSCGKKGGISPVLAGLEKTK